MPTKIEQAYEKGFKEGYEKALDDHHILHGKAAEKFLKNLTKKPTKKQLYFLDECEKMAFNIKHKE